jgi:hypothetical protein
MAQKYLKATIQRHGPGELLDIVNNIHTLDFALVHTYPAALLIFAAPNIKSSARFLCEQSFIHGY